jgi:SAM-dependent methyltransferase
MPTRHFFGSSLAGQMAADDLLRAHLREVPAFRALLRSVEARFYKGLALPGPVLDLGCGDGHFASLALPGLHPLGVDRAAGPLREAARRRVYRAVVRADASSLPFRSGTFGTVVSNSVLEHIPGVEAVLAEVARVLRTGGRLVFSVPSEHFKSYLSVGRFLDRLSLSRLADAYRDFFNRISRHVTCQSPAWWSERLLAAGLEPVHCWYYFSPTATALLEWGHLYGLPSLFFKKLTGRWVIAPWAWSLGPVERLLRPFFDQAPASSGAYFFMIAVKS